VRIGLLTTSFPRRAGDYAGSFVGDRVARLVADGHDVDVIAAGDAGFSEGHHLTVTRLFAAAGLFYGTGAPERLEAGGAWFAAAAFFAALAAATRARAGAWDVIESHWLVPCAAAASTVAPDRPRRAWAHSGDVSLLERLPLGRTLARRLARDGTDLRFVSADLRARFGRLVGGPVGTVEPIPLADGAFAPRSGADAALRRRLGLMLPTVLSVGRLVPIKGHTRLIHGASLAAAKGHTAEVVILGDGPERERLAGLAGRLGVPLRLPGFVPRAEVAAWMRAADLMVLPSIPLPNGRSEGAPTVLREAAAVGIPAHAISDPAEISRAIAAIAPRAHSAPGESNQCVRDV
jgi:glycosyltransferase involved in cell wall biosynthesis